MHNHAHGGATTSPSTARRRFVSARRKSAAVAVATLTFLTAAGLDAPASAQTIEQDTPSGQSSPTTTPTSAENAPPEPTDAGQASGNETDGPPATETAPAAGEATVESTDEQTTDAETTEQESTEQETTEQEAAEPETAEPETTDAEFLDEAPTESEPDAGEAGTGDSEKDGEQALLSADPTQTTDTTAPEGSDQESENAESSASRNATERNSASLLFKPIFGVVISGSILVDTDQNGTFETSPYAISVQLLDSGGTVVKTAALDLTTSKYRFTSVGVGNFTVRPVLDSVGLYPAVESDGTPNGRISVTTNSTTGISGQDFFVAPQAMSPDTSTNNSFGTAVTLDVLANDHYGGTPTGVTLSTGSSSPSTSLYVPNEGTWTVNPGSFSVTFTPVAAFGGTTTPITYTVSLPNNASSSSSSSTVSVSYIAPEVTDAQSSGHIPRQSVTISPLDGTAGQWDPASIRVIAPNGNRTTSTSISSVGTWQVNTANGTITFNPAAGIDTKNTTSMSINYEAATPGCSNSSYCHRSVGTVSVSYIEALDTFVLDMRGPTGSQDGNLSSAYGAGYSLDLGSFRFIHPTTGASVTSLTISGEGTWRIGVPTTGTVRFEPLAGVHADATPVGFTVNASAGNVQYYGTVESPVGLTFAIAPSVDNIPGTTVTIPSSEFSDPQLPSGTVLKRFAGSTSGGNTLTTADGTWSFLASGDLSFVPSSQLNGNPSPVDVYLSPVAHPQVRSDSVVTITYAPTWISPASTNNAPGAPATSDPLANDNGTLNPATVRFINLTTGQPTTTLSVSGEGTWTVSPGSGEITFTPATGFAGNPTAVTLSAHDQSSNDPQIYYSTATVAYGNLLSTSTSVNAVPGSTVSVDPLANDSGTLDSSSVRLVNPETGAAATTVFSPGEGTWTVSTTTGIITFTPLAGVTDDPTPVGYTVDNLNDNTKNYASAAVDYAEVLNTPTVTGATPGTSVSIDPLAGDNGTLDPTSVLLTNPTTGQPITTLSVSGEGAWTVDPNSGLITFTPESGFTDDPTPVNFTVDNLNDNDTNYSTVAIDYAEVLSTPTVTGARPGTTVTIDPTAGNSGTLDATSVKLTNPSTGLPVTALPINGEGTWTVNPTSGLITFTPEAGFTGDPTPVDYTVDNLNDSGVNHSTADIDYAEVLNTPAVTGAIPRTPVTIDPLAADNGSLDPTSVELISPATGLSVTTLPISGEGTWTVDPTSGLITFTPEAGFTDDPTPIDFTIDNLNDNDTNYATATIDYAEVLNTPAVTGAVPGSSVTIDPLAGDNGSLDPASVELLDPGTAQPTSNLTVPNQGTWTVNSTSGLITFTPEAGFTGDPTPVDFTIDNLNNADVNYSTADIDYAAVFATPSVSLVIPGALVTVDPLAAGDNGDLDPTSVKFINPDTSQPVTTLPVSGEGTWTVNQSTGLITFTPEAGFTSERADWDVTVDYTIDNLNNDGRNYSTVYIDYAAVFSTPAVVGVAPTTPVTIVPPDGDDDPLFSSTFDAKLIDPATNQSTTALSISGEGTWTVDAATDEITFTPETGFAGDPTPVTYIVWGVYGTDQWSFFSTASIDYANVLDAPVVTGVVVGSAASIDPLAGDNGTLDAATVQLIDPATGQPTTTLTVPGEGTWSVNPSSGLITFTPEAGYTDDPTPVDFTIDNLNNDDVNYATAAIDYATSIDVPTVIGAAPGGSASIDPLAGDNGTLDAATVQLIDPATGQSTTTLIVPGEGTWSVNPSSGLITFTPEAGFTDDPTPVDFTIDNLNDDDVNYATAAIDYATLLDGQTRSGAIPGSPAAIDTLAGDNGTLDPTSVRLIDPGTGQPTTTLTVPGEGTWVVGTTTGIVMFTPEAGFTDDPTPVGFTVDNLNDGDVNYAVAAINYANLIDTPTVSGVAPGTVVSIDPLAADDGSLDPTSVHLIDPTTGQPTTMLSVPGEGTWTVHPTSGVITFTPTAAFTTFTQQNGFSNDPTPVGFTIDNLDDDDLNYSTAAIDYANVLNLPEGGVHVPGTAATIDPLANSVEPLDPASVRLLNPSTGAKSVTLAVPGEGTWSVNPNTGVITFTPETNFTNDPTPINFTINNLNNDDINHSTATIDYANPLHTPTVSATTPGTTVTIDPLQNDNGTLDPTTVKLINPATDFPATTLTIPGQGTWTVNPNTGVITFTPETNFTNDPTPINFTINNLNNDEINHSTATINYPNTNNDPTNTNPPTRSSSPRKPGQFIEIDPLHNDQGNWDPTSLRLIDTNNNPTQTINTTNVGTWLINTTTNTITFAPDQAFTDPTTSITYEVDTTNCATDPNCQTGRATITANYWPTFTTPTITGITPGTTTTITPNHYNPNQNLDPTTISFDTPNGTLEPTVNIPGQGTWTTNPNNGNITFTPEPGFTTNPTPIGFTAFTTPDYELHYSTLTIIYTTNDTTNTDDSTTDDSTTDDSTTDDSTTDDSTTDDSTNTDDSTTDDTNDTSNSGDSTTNDTSNTGDDSTNTATGTTDTSSATGTDSTDYATKTTGPFTINPLQNDDGSLDPTSVRLIDPASGQGVLSLTIAGEGTWTVNPDTGLITFTPEPGFNGNPTPLGYTISANNDDTIAHRGTTATGTRTPTGQLAFTGTATPSLVKLALLLTLLGAALTALTRRRTPPANPSRTRQQTANILRCHTSTPRPLCSSLRERPEQRRTQLQLETLARTARARTARRGAPTRSRCTIQHRHETPSRGPPRFHGRHLHPRRMQQARSDTLPRRAQTRASI